MAFPCDCRRCKYLTHDILTILQVYISEPYEPRRKYMADKIQVNVCSGNKQVVEKCQVIILAVKPNHVPDVLNEAADVDLTDKV